MEALLERTRELIRLALSEDLDRDGDITSEAVFQGGEKSTAVISSRQQGTVCGLYLVDLLFSELGGGVKTLFSLEDGTVVESGATILKMHGEVKILLRGERTLLNFLARLSGIATAAREYRRLLDADRPILLDTRKTTPGWRLLEKYAVLMGGMRNHRLGLYDMYMIKDNHIRAAGGITPALEKVHAHRRRHDPQRRIEIEVRTPEEFHEALAGNPDVIMLDHFTNEQIARVVSIPRGDIQLEVSGNVNAARLADLRASGVDLVSLGAVTHSAPAFDFSMNLEDDI